MARCIALQMGIPVMAMQPPAGKRNFSKSCIVYLGDSKGVDKVLVVQDVALASRQHLQDGVLQQTQLCLHARIVHHQVGLHLRQIRPFLHHTQKCILEATSPSTMQMDDQADWGLANVLPDKQGCSTKFCIQLA